ncbi:hypothetical protein K501DRAFT_189987 [Backusella circina FSU 941]|nr:hypothetical protein K501DRAFT_189987 [Backusella circina FSU 941]
MNLDAAHCHSPAGGQGMNLGMQDADNLAWKISAVLKGQVVDPESLLNSYETERIPHAKETIKTTSVATETGLKEGYLMNITRQCLMSAVLGIPQMREYAFKTVMQQNLSISSSDSKILGTSDKGLIKSGTFFPDTVPLRKRFVPSGESLIERRSLRSYLTNNHQYVLLFVNTCHPANLPNEDILKTFWKRSKSYPVRRLVIQSPWHAHTTARPEYVTPDEFQDVENGFYIEERIEDTMSVTSRVGLLPLLSKYFGSSQEPSVLLMIRPDFYVTHARVVSNEADLESAYKYIDTVFK